MTDTLIVPTNQIVVPPGLVPDGKLVRAAAIWQQTPEVLIQRITEQPMVVPFINNAGLREDHKSIPPHPIAGDFGAKLADVLIISEAPNIEELELRRLHAGVRGKMWKDVLDVDRVHYQDWVAVTCCWWGNDGKKTPAKDFKECQHLLALTLNAVQPKFVLCLGAAALKSFWTLADPVFARGLKFKDARGAVMDYPGGIKVMAGISPGNVLADPSTSADFMQDIRTFGRLTRGSGPSTTDKQYTIIEIDHQAQLEKLVDELIEKGCMKFAVDCEGILKGQLRTIQFAWSDHEGAVVILRREGMVPAFSPSMNCAFEPLWRLFKRPGVTISGHNFRGDLKWLLEYGLDLTDEFINGGIDTMLAYHELDEVGEKQLEIVALRMLGLRRYDAELRKWLADNKYGKEDYQEFGYGAVPDGILHPYSVMDAIATWALAELLEKEIKIIPGLWNHYLTCVHATNLPLMEMEQNGILVDTDRIRDMAELIDSKTIELKALLQKKLNWPNFNPGSSPQVAELLFDMPPMKDGKRQFRAPADAIKFHLTPIKATDKTNGLVWDRVLKLPPEQQFKHTPSTDSESVAILAADCPALNDFRRFKTIDQLRKNFLRSEVEDDDTGELGFEKGMGSWVAGDGRMHTTFRTTLETGRYATSPNLQNLPKRQEKEIAKCFQVNDTYVLSKEDDNKLKLYWTGVDWSRFRADSQRFHSKDDAAAHSRQYGGEVTQLIDPRYYPLRTIFVASPGTVLVEPDWNQAELWTLGALAGDEEFLHILATSDMHTTMLQKMFGSMMYKGKLIQSYTVPQLNELRKSDKYLDALRTSAKTTVFGIPYQRGAAAIIREIKREGIHDQTNQAAQGWIDTFHATFQKTSAFLRKCTEEVINPGHIINPYGRYRRFPATNDRDLIAAYQREAVNYPVQSTVGDSMSVALINFWTYRRYVNRNLSYRLLLSVHDAVLLEVPVDQVAEVCEKVIPACMVDGVIVPKIGLKYSIGDIDVQLRWGEKPDPNELLSMGVDRRFCGFKEKKQLTTN